LVRGEVEAQRAERKLRSHLQHDAVSVVRKPDLGASTLGEDALRLDDRLDHDRVELTGGDTNALAPEHANDNRVAIGTEVTIELVRRAHLERDRADKIEERAIVERFGHGWCFFLARFQEHAAFGHDLEAALALTSPLVELLMMAKRNEPLH